MLVVDKVSGFLKGISNAFMRHLGFNYDERIRFLRIFKSRLDRPNKQMNDILRNFAQYKVTVESDVLARKSLALSGKPVAASWASDGHFSEFEATLMTRAQERSGREGLVIAIEHIIESSSNVSFWRTVLSKRNLALLFGGGFALSTLIYLSGDSADQMNVFLATAGGDVRELLLVQMGDWVRRYLWIIAAVWFTLYMVYRHLRNNVIIDVEARNNFNRLGFFVLYDKHFEYELLGVLGAFFRLGCTSRECLDAAQSLYANKKYESTRLKDVELAANDGIEFVEALYGHVLSESAHGMLKGSMDDVSADQYVVAMEEVRFTLSEMLNQRYNKIGWLIVLSAGSILFALFFGILDMTTYIAEL